jgi:5-carboxymethyl-2-hydroxymuconate isomerase
MPHLVIEYAEEIIQHPSPQEIMQAAYTGAVKSELFSPSGIKAHARSY